MVSMKDTTILRKLIAENPDLPVLLFVGEEAYIGEYGYNQADCSKGEIRELTLYDDMWLDKDGYEEKLSDDLADDEKYEDLSDEEYGKMIKQKVSETEFVKVIALWIG